MSLIVRSMPVRGLFYAGRRHNSVQHGERIEPDALYIHWSAGTGDLSALHRLLVGRAEGRMAGEGSYNFGIDRLGEIGEFADPRQYAVWHAGDDYKGVRGMVPSAEHILTAGFLRVQDVAPAQARWTNLRSVAVCICNEGFVQGTNVPRRRARGVTVVEARHANPASRSTHWEAYTAAQIEALRALVPHLKERCPSLRMVVGHEDSTNGYVYGRGKWAGGSKLDPGPLFPWDAIDWAASGLQVVKFDYERRGWAVQKQNARKTA